MYKYDLEQTLSMWLNTSVRSCIAHVYRDRERECVCVFEVVASTVTAACGKEEDKRSLPLCILVVVFLSHSVFYSLWTAVVFPTFGFPR